MPQTCSICRHERRKMIDGELIEGVPLRDIARRYGVSKDALARHKSEHLPERLSRAKAAETVASADNLLDQLDQLRKRAMSLLDQAEAAGDFSTALRGVREARACLETLAEVSGELNRQPVIVLTQHPEWVDLRGRIVAALRPFPDARLHVLAALSDGELRP